MKILKLTRPDKLPLYVNAESVSHFTPAVIPGDNGKTEIAIGGTPRRVLETCDEILAMLKNG